MGTKCGKEDASILSEQKTTKVDYSALNTVDFMGQSTIKQRQASTINKMNCVSSYKLVDKGSCAYCDEAIKDSGIKFCEHAYHAKCLMELIQSHFNLKQQRFKCTSSSCQIYIGAQFIKKIKFPVPQNLYYCITCKESCILQKPTRIDGCQFCTKSEGLALFEQQI